MTKQPPVKPYSINHKKVKGGLDLGDDAKRLYYRKRQCNLSELVIEGIYAPSSRDS